MNTLESNANDLIVLVHGFGAKRAVMWPLAHRLRLADFRVVAWNYVSLFDSIEKHGKRFYDFLATQLTMERRTWAGLRLIARSLFCGLRSQPEFNPMFEKPKRQFLIR